MKLKYAVLTASSFFALASATSIHADQVDLEKYLTVTSVETSVVESPVPAPVPSDEVPGDVPVPGGTIDIGEIIRIGSEIWKIIEKNAPVVDQKFEPVSLVPQGITHWDQLGGWSAPETRVYKKTYKNAYGMAVVEFNYRIAYTANGNYDGKGAYLSRVEIEPATLNVAWGYKFSVVGEVINPTNAGTSADPIAAMELRVNWQLNTVLRHMQSSERYYVRGDGLFKDLSDGTLPSETL